MGEAVKHVPDCFKHGFNVYFALPKYKDTELAFRPVQGRRVCFSTTLRVYSKRYLKGYEPLGVNLLRKRFTKTMLLAAGITDEKLKDFNGAQTFIGV